MINSKKTTIKTVLVVSKHMIYGGAEKYTLNLVNSLVEKDISVVLVTGDGPLIKHVSPKVKIYILPISRNLRIRQYVEQKILNIAKLHKAEIIHADSRTSMVCSQLTRNSLNIPLISHEHHMYNQKDYPFIVSELKEGADKIITIGPYTRKMLNSHGVEKEKIVSIINGINLADYSAVTADERIKARIQLGFSESDKIILCISRVVYGKGIDKLIMGFKIIARKYRNVKLIIVGDDEEMTNFKQSLKQMIIDYKLQKQIFIYPGDYNIRKYHAVANIFCYPALVKGMSVMEAMASGLPVVGKRTDRKPLVVEHLISGLMTDSTKNYKIDPGQIAEKLSYLLARPRVTKNMGIAARKRIEQLYSLDKHILKILKVYKSVIADHKNKLTPNIDQIPTFIYE